MRGRGEGTIRSDGYIQICGKNKKDIRFAHVIIAEKVLGGRLPPKAVVHHADGNRSNNNNSNLVICPNTKYHMLLHMRIRAVMSGFPPNYRMCEYCRSYDRPENLYIKPNGCNPMHRICKQKKRKEKGWK